MQKEALTREYDSIYKHFRINSPLSYVTPDRSACAASELKDGGNVLSVYSLISQNEQALETLFRQIIKNTDSLGLTVVIDLFRTRLDSREVSFLRSKFEFEPDGFSTKLTRTPKSLTTKPYEIVYGVEKDDSLTIVNNSSKDVNCYVVRNIYSENLGVFYSYSDAEVFLNI